MKRLIGIIIVLVIALFIAVQPKPKPIENYSVVFYTSGGTKINTIETVSNSKINAPKDPVRGNAEFGGWYLSPDYDEDSKFDFNTIITKSITLYAKWTSETYTIVYHLGDGYWPSDEVKDLYPTKISYESGTVRITRRSNAQSPHHPNGIINKFNGWRTIPQDEYNALSKDEQSNYPYITRFNTREDDMDEIFGEEKSLNLYAHYMNIK